MKRGEEKRKSKWRGYEKEKRGEEDMRRRSK
jgi:hypothetical protein